MLKYLRRTPDPAAPRDCCTQPPRVTQGTASYIGLLVGGVCRSTEAPECTLRTFNQAAPWLSRGRSHAICAAARDHIELRLVHDDAQARRASPARWQSRARIVSASSAASIVVCTKSIVDMSPRSGTNQFLAWN